MPTPTRALPHLILALVLWLWPAAVGAQEEPEFFDTPFADKQWTYGRRLDESQLRYCVDPRDPDWEVAATIADTVASALLLEPQRYVVDKQNVLEDITRVYALMLEHCDVHMGFKLLSEGYPDWASVTSAYYDAQYAFVTADPDLHALADLAPSRKIGATIGTTAHLRLVSYLTALPAGQRWPTFPYGTNDLALEQLAQGVVDVALVWAPSFWGKQQTDPAFANFHIIDPRPLPPTEIGVGALVLSNHKFLLTAIDEAIAALTADGTIGRILESYKFPATPAK